MDYEPNVEAVTFFVREVWPAVRRAHPEATFTIVGSRPTQSVKALGAVPGVRVTGFVPDVNAFLATSTLVVVALAVARGIQNKILEAMAAGVPVLTTPEAAKGFPAAARETLFVEPRDPATFPAAVLRALADRKGLQRKADAARAYVREHYSWEANVKTLEDLILQARSGRPAPALPTFSAAPQAKRPARD